VHRLADWMTPRPITVHRDTPLGDCARAMESHGVRHLPVVDNAGALQGVLTDADLFSRGRLIGPERVWAAWDPVDHERPARELAVPVFVVAQADVHVRDALDRLLRSPQDLIVVADGGRAPIGIFTEHDGVRMAAELLPATRLGLRKRRGPLFTVAHDAPALDAWHLMQEVRIRHVLVMAGETLTGVLSWRDLVREEVPGGGRWLRAGELVVGQDLLTVEEGTPVVEIARQLHSRHVGCAPLVDFARRPVGIVTRTDLVAWVTDELAAIA
jgi:CBS domain-containing membrane protein